MPKHNTLFTLFATAAIILSVSSCKKETQITDTKSKVSFEQSKKVAKQLFAMTMPAGGSFAFKNGSFDCVTVTVDSSSGYVKIFDYGTGCTDDQGIVRKGIIRAAYNNENIQTPGTLIQFTFDNFFVNNDQVKGGMSLENKGANGSGNWVIHYTTDCQDFSLVNGMTQLDADQYFEWTAGGNTSAYDDDVFSITGSFEATIENNNKYSVLIQQPLIAKTAPGCNQYFTSGTTITKTSGEPDRYLDYGEGDCDNLAKETVNGETKVIVLE